MKNFHLIKLISIFILFGSFSTKAQTSTYTVSGPTRGPGSVLNMDPIGFWNVWNPWNTIHLPIAYGGASVNSWSSAQSIGFRFSFYGSPATHFCVSKNYLLTFDTTVAGTTVNSSITTDNTALPNANLPDHTIAYFWGGFGNPPPLGSNDTVQMKTFGTTPNRQLWVRNFSYEFEAQDWSYNFVVLEETTHKIYVVDGAWESQGVGSYTVGVQLNSTTAVQHPNSPNISSINGNFFTPWPNVDVDYYEFTPRYNFNLLGCPAPSSSIATHITQTGARLFWTTGGASNWDLEYGFSGFTLGSGTRISTTTPSYTVSGLTSGQSYQFYVRDSCGGGNVSTWVGPQNFRTLSCPSPSSLLATHITQISAELSWVSGGASNWDLEYGFSGFTLGSGTRISTTTRSYAVSGLTSGTDYDFYVRDSCGVGDVSGWVGPVTFTTLSTSLPCPAPSSSFASLITQTRAKLLWLSGGASNWDLEYGLSGFTLGSGTRISTTTPSYTVSGLTPGTDYDFYVRDSCGVGDVSSWAGPVTFTTLSATLTCPDPSFLKAFGITQTDAELNWASGGASNWNIEYGLSGFTLGSGTRISTTIPSYTVSGLTSGTDYDFYVRDSCGVGDVSGWVGPVTFAALSATLPCPDPSFLKAFGITQTDAELNWASGGASNWNIEYGLSGFTLGSGTRISTTIPSYTVSGLTSGTDYDFYVRDSCGVGDVSGWVGPVTFTTLSATLPCPSPSSLLAVNITQTRAVLFWITGGAFNWNIEYGLSGFTLGGGTRISTTTRSYTVSGLTSGTDYDFYVRDSCGVGDVSGWVGPVTFTTLSTSLPCPAPSSLLATHITQTGVRLSWVSGGASNWNIEWSFFGFTLGNGTRISTTTPSYTVSGLTSGQSYQFYVRDSCGGGDVSTWSGPQNFRTLRCPSSSSLLATHITQTSAELSWISLSGGASNWDLEYGLSGFTLGSGIRVRTATNPHTLTALTPGTTYDFYVRDSCGSNNLSTWAGPYNFTISCSSPSSLLATHITQTGARLSWVSGGASNWNIEYGFSGFTLGNGTRISTTTPSYTVSGLILSGQSYQFYVRDSCDGGNVSTWSGPQNFRTLSCPYPLSLLATHITQISAELSWVSGGASNWNIEYGLSGFTLGSGTRISTTTPSYTVSGLTSGQSYQFYVRDSCGGGNVSTWSGPQNFRTLSCSSPSSLLATQITQIGARLFWIIGGDASNWDLEYGFSGFTLGSGTRISTTTSSYTVSGLTSGQSYQFYVRDSCGRGNVSTWSGPQNFRTLSCPSPSSLLATHITQTSAELSWISGGASNWNIEYGLSGFTLGSGTRISTTTPSYTVSSLTSGQSYQFYVRDSCGGGNVSTWSGPQNFRTLSCPSPSSLLATHITQISAELSWVSGGASNWNIEYGLSGFTLGSGTQISTTTPSYTVSGLTSGQSYQFYVRDSCGGGNVSTWSGPQNFRTLSCPSPSSLLATHITQISAELSWVSGGAANWDLEYGLSGFTLGSGTRISTTPFYTVSGLTSGQSYQFYVRDSCGGGNVSTWSGPQNFRTLSCPSPSSLLATHITQTSAELSWISGGASNWNIEYGLSGFTLGSGTRISTTTPSYTVSSLTSGQSYQFYVRDSCGGGNVSTWSGPQNFRTLSCPSPSSLLATHITQISAELSWVSVSGGASSWDLEYGLSGFTLGSGTRISTTTPFYTVSTVSGLTSGQSYQFYVRDSCGRGNVSTWAGPQNFRTLSCPYPLSLLATHITQTSAELSWISGGASNWNIEWGTTGFTLGSGTFVYNVSNPYILTRLTPGTDYDFYVRDSCGGGNVSTWSGLRNFRTLSCPSPSSLLATHITQTSAELSWLSGGASNWNIEWGFSGFTLGSGTRISTTTPFYTVSGLTSGQSYQFYVRDSCGGGNVSTWSGPQNFRTLSCPSPSSLLATHITQTSAELSWISGGASNWNIEWGTTGFTLGSGTFVYNVSNPYILTRLTPGTDYDFHVRDSCGGGNVSTWVGPQNFRTLSCPSPSSLLATHITQTSAELSWLSGGASNWNIEWGFSGFTLGSGTRISTTTPFYTVSGLTSGQSYQFYVRDSCGGGNVSTWSGPQNFRTLSCPSPSSLLATHITQTSAELSWLSGGASNWNIEYGFSGFILGSGTFVYNVSNPYTLNRLTPGTDYDFYVRDSCGRGNVSTWVGPQNFRTLSCPSPSSLLATHITQTSAELSWLSGGASNWDLEYGFSGFTLGSGTRISTTTPSYTVSGLTSGQSYQFYVQDSCGGGNVSTWVGPQNFRTLSCPSPSSLLTTHITQTSAELSWLSGGASNWNIEYGFSGFILGSGTFVYNVSNPYTLNRLTPGTDYDFYVRDSCGRGNVSTWVGPQNFRTLSCPSPSSLLATHITQISAELSWLSGGAFNWNIEYGFSGFTLGSGTFVYNVSNPYTLNRLTPGTDYDFYVRDSCGRGNVSTWSGPQNFRTLSCPSPSSLLATHITQTTAELSWISGGASNWNIEYGFSGFTLGSGTFVYNVSNPYTLNRLTPGTDYDFYVRDSCGRGNVSTWVGPQNFRTLSCPSPSSLLATHITQTSAELSWLSGGASNWDLEYGLSGFTLGSGTRISTTPFYTVSGLTSGQSYQFYVRDSCGGGNVSTWVGPQNFRTLSCPSPSSLLTTHITQTSAELSWLSGGASNWNIEWGFSGFTLGSGTFVYNVSNPYTLNRLTTGTTYDFYVRDSCGVGHVSSWAGPDTFTTLSATLPCSSPSSLLATHITQTSAELSWLSGGAFNWNIEYGFSGFTLGSGTFVYNVSNPYTLNRLTPGTDYDFYVRDSCGRGNVSTWVGPQNFRTLSCPSPSSLLATHITQTTAELSWISGGASNWNIEYGFSGFTLGSGTFVYNVSNPYTLNRLTPGTDYDFYVRDSCGRGNVSTWVGPQNFRTLSCPSPSSLLATHITQTSAELSWLSGGASNWDLEYGFSGFTLGSGTRISTTTPSYTVSGLTSGQSYQFYVRDSCGRGNVSTWVGPQNFRTLSCPSPSSLLATHITQTTAELSWISGGASNWNIEYGFSGFTLGSGTFVYNVSNPYTLNRLTTGTTYDFYVRDSCGVGHVSTWVGPQNFRTLSCPSPSSLLATHITQTSAELSWLSGGASNWDLEYGFSGFTLGSGTRISTTTPSYTVSGLTSGQSYQFYVRDSCGGGNVSTWSGPQNFRTLSCPSPSSLLTTHITQTSAELSWLSGGASNWNIEWGFSGFTLGSGTFVYNVSNPYTLNHLTTGTTYDFYVRDSCGVGHVSSWAGPDTFTTLSATLPCSSPSSLLATHITQTSAELSWLSGGAFNWNIEYGFSGFTLGSGTFVYNVSNPYTLNRLTPGTDYDFYVRDSCGVGHVSSWTGLGTFTTLSAILPCPSPSSLLATHITQTSAELSWLSGGAFNWNIEYGFSGFTLGSGTRISTTTPSYTVSGLTSGQSYQFYVRDSCGGGNVSTWSGPQNFRTLSCPSPSSLLTTHITQISAELSWVSGGASNWDLEYGFSGFTLGSGTRISTTTPSYTVSGLTSGQSYQFYVRDSCGGGNVSTWSGPQNFRTLSCPSPSSLLATHITQISAELSWLSGGAFNWNIEYGFSGFTLGSGTRISTTTPSYTVSGLTSGQSYQFYVRDSCGGGNVSTWVGPQNFRTLSCPSPSSLLATHITQISAELSWLSGGASNWNIEWGFSGFTLGSGTFVYNVLNPYTLNRLTPGTDYDFYVRDSCGVGHVSSWAGPDTFTTLSATLPCPSPSSLLTTHITQTSAELSWVSGGAFNWNIEYGFSGFTLGSGAFVYNVSNPYTLNRLTVGTTYDFYVRDSCGVGHVSSWAGPDTFTTLSATLPCPSPSSLLATHITQTSAELSWLSGGAFNWNIEYGFSGFTLGSGTFVYNVSNPYTLNRLTPGTDYDFYVRDSCGRGNVSTWVGPQNFRTLSCPSPSSLLATHITQTSAELSWLSGGASNWDLEYGFSGFTLGSGTRISTTTPSYTVSGLTSGQSYQFYVQDSCGGGNVSTWVGPQNFRTLSCPSPSSLLTTHITQTSAELSWLSGGASNWNIEYGFSGFILGSGTFVYNVSNPYTLNRLTPGTDYDFYVRDSCGRGNVSTWVGPQNFRTLSCPSPSSLLATHITQISAELSWLSGGAFNWNIEYGFSGFTLGSGTFVYNVSNPYTLNRLTPGTDYDFYVRDSCGRGNVSTWSGPQNFRTLSCPSPSSLLATHITQTTAELSWISGGASNWNIEYGFSGFTLGSGTFVYNVSNPYTLNRLTPGTDYDFYVRDSCGRGNVSTWVGPQNFRTLSCPSPSSLLATHITQTSAELSWLSGGASNWDLEYGLSGFTLGSGTRISTTPFYTVSGLTSGQSYQFYVRDSCGGGNVSTWVGPQNFRTLSCPSPSSLLTTHITQTSAELSWLSGGASNWDLEYGFSGFTLGSGTRISTTTPSYTVSGLTSGQSYQFYVRDSCGGGNVSTWSGPQNFRTLSCPSPSSLLATHITQINAELSWLSGGAFNWNIEYGFSGFTLGSGTRISTTTPSYTVSGLTSGQSYQFYVRDSCGVGHVSSWAGPDTFTTLSATLPCSSPSSLLATHITQTSAELSWLSGGAFNWNIEYGFSGFTLGSGTFVYNVSNPYTLNRLTPGTDYDFYVRDSCGVGHVSSWAGPDTFTTLSATLPCPSPSSLLTTHITQTSAELSWVSGGAFNWNIEYGFSGFTLGSGAFVYNVSNPYTLNRLTVGTTYDFYVRDSCGVGHVSSWAGPDTFTTLSATLPCPSPSSLLATHITQTSAELSWLSGGAFNWNIEYGFSGFTLGSGTFVYNVSNPYTLNRLTPGTDYDFYVRDSCGRGNVSTWVGPQNFRTLSCPSPSSLLATHITQTSAELSWLSGGASNWDLEYGFSGFTLGSGTRISTTTPSYTVSGLTSGQSYQFYVQDSCGGGNVSTWVGPQNFRTLSCPSPSSLLTTHITQTSAELSWLSGGASNWNIEYGFSGFILGSGTFVYNVSNPYTLNRLTPGTDYDFYVRDSCGRGNVSTWVGPQNFRTLSCPSPSSLLATHITQISAELSWVSGGASNWDLEYGLSGFTLGSGTRISTTPFYTVSGLTSGQSYQFYVRDSCGGGNVSTWVGPQNFRTLSCPSPSSLLTTHITQTSAELSWLSGGASNWNIEWGFSGFTLGSGTFVYNVSNPYTLNRLTTGTTYDFYVRDSCGRGNVSTWVGPQNFRTLSCPSPSSLLATHITQISAELSWVSGGASNWDLEYGLSGFTLGSGTRISTTPFYTVSGLTSGQSYQFYVRDSCGGGNVSTWVGPQNFRTLSCPSPSSLLTTHITQTSAELSWLSGGASNWNIEWGFSGFTLGSGTFVYNVSNPYTLNRLTTGTTYDFYVRDSCGVGHVSSWAGPDTFTTLSATLPCSSPSSLLATHITQTSAELSWLSGGAFNWNIEYGFSGFTLGSGTRISTTTPFYTVSGLTAGRSYQFYVRDSCGGGNVSTWSGPQNFRTLSCPSPSSLLATHITQISAELSWVSGGASNWNIEYGFSGFILGSGTFVYNVSNPYTLNRLTPGTDYDFYVRDSCGGGNVSTWSGPQNFRTLSCPSPSSLLATHITQTSAELSWVSGGASNWNIEYGLSGFTLGSGTRISTTTPFYTVSGLTSGQSYQFYVRDSCGVGYVSSWAGPHTFRTLGCLALAPTGLKLDTITEIIATVSWTSGGASNWNIEYGPINFPLGSGIFLYNMSSPRTLRGLRPSIFYDVYVQDSCNVGNVSNWMGPLSIKTFIGIDELLERSLRIYPNPSEGVFKLEFSSSLGEDMEIRITNMMGQIVLEDEIESFSGSYRKRLEMGAYRSGVYLLQLITERATVNRRIILQ